MGGSFSLESKQEWFVVESFYWVGFSGGMFFQKDFGKKVLPVCTSKITLKFSGVYSNQECLI